MLFSTSAFGQMFQEYRPMMRSPEALLMGDAFTALADDAFTLFYNPAALGKNRGVEVYPLNFSLGLTNAYSERDRFKDFPSDPVDIAQRVMDFPLHTQLSTAPGIKVGGFGFSLIANNSTNIVLQNSVNPILSVDYRYDSGFVMGYAVNITSRGPSLVGLSPHRQGHRFSLGFSVKHIKREGLAEDFNFFGPRILNAIQNASDFREIRENLGYSKGKAWGTDFGMEYSYRAGHTEFLMGLSLMDILDTDFKRTSGDVPLPNQKMSLNFGSAVRQNFGLFNTTLSFDMHPILESIDYRRKLHFGAKLGTPLLDVFGGWSGGYTSYGASLKIWPLKLTAGVYSSELGADYNDNRGSRAILYLSLFETKFNL